MILLLGALLCVGLSVARVTSSASTTPGAGATARTHVVQPGDTLWEIAHDLAPDADTRVVVARLSQLNGLESATLRPGQAIRLP